MTYKIQISLLSQAPQLISKKFSVGNKVLKYPNQSITENNIKKCVKEIFPIGSIIRVKEVKISNVRFRQNIEVILESLRKPSKDFKITDILPDFYTFKVEELNVQHV